ncbi:hypothetical protein ACLBWT_01020 [Paenibacillus sp. D51F]
MGFNLLVGCGTAGSDGARCRSAGAASPDESVRKGKAAASQNGGQIIGGQPKGAVGRTVTAGETA